MSLPEAVQETPSPRQSLEPRRPLKWYLQNILCAATQYIFTCFFKMTLQKVSPARASGPVTGRVGWEAPNHPVERAQEPEDLCCSPGSGTCFFKAWVKPIHVSGHPLSISELEKSSIYLVLVRSQCGLVLLWVHQLQHPAHLQPPSYKCPPPNIGIKLQGKLLGK